MRAAWGVVSKASTTASGIPGVYMKRGVVLTDDLRTFLAALRQRLAFDVVVTSAVRTPSAQAAALAQDHNFAVYSQQDLVRELTAGGSRPSAAAMTRVLQSQVNRGRYLSRHMRSDALDFRVSGVSATERAQLKSTLSAMGGRVLDEGDHIHVEAITGGLVQRLREQLPSVQTVAVAGAGLWLAWSLVTLTVAGIAWYFLRRRR